MNTLYARDANSVQYILWMLTNTPNPLEAIGWEFTNEEIRSLWNRLILCDTIDWGAETPIPTQDDSQAKVTA